MKIRIISFLLILISSLILISAVDSVLPVIQETGDLVERSFSPFLGKNWSEALLVRALQLILGVGLAGLILRVGSVRFQKQMDYLAGKSTECPPGMYSASILMGLIIGIAVLIFVPSLLSL